MHALLTRVLRVASRVSHTQNCSLNFHSNAMAPGQEEATKEERLKAALWYSVGQMVDSIASEQDVDPSPHFIGALSEMLWVQIGKSKADVFTCREALLTDAVDTASCDLEAFATHAGRLAINTNDVLLLARRNDGLRDVLHRASKQVQARNHSR